MMVTALPDNRVNSTKRIRLREAALPTAVGISVFAASLLNFLGAEHYPLFTREVALPALLVVALPIAIGLVYAAAERIGRATLQVLLLFVALDLNFDGWSVPISTAIIALLLNRRLMPFLGISSAVVLITSLPNVSLTAAARGPALPEARVGADLPNIVHIILDEHIGVEGLDVTMKDRLRSFYVGNGFRLFGGAYSEYFRTINSIPHLLNLGQPQPWANEDAQTGTVVTRNEFFDRLRSRGYRINVHQSHFIDYCIHPAVSICDTNPRSDLLALIDAPLSTEERAVLVTYHFARQSRPLGWLMSMTLARLGIPVTGLLPHASSAIATLRQVAERVSHPIRGQAHFVHVLSPHYPYVVDRNCALKPVASWLARRVGTASTRSRPEIDRAYFEQIACLTSMLQPIFDAAGPDAILVVQGDHGSRITDVDPSVATIGSFSKEDMIASFSTLFAVRAPGIQNGYDRRPIPIGELFRTFVLSDLKSIDVRLASGFIPSVVLDEANWRPSARRQPLPLDWPNADRVIDDLPSTSVRQ